jgi:hypothetical protein
MTIVGSCPADGAAASEHMINSNRILRIVTSKAGARAPGCKALFV